jgi:hypothetical protein
MFSDDSIPFERIMGMSAKKGKSPKGGLLEPSIDLLGQFIMLWENGL